jgi:hypothetical protein
MGPTHKHSQRSVSSASRFVASTGPFSSSWRRRYRRPILLVLLLAVVWGITHVNHSSSSSLPSASSLRSKYSPYVYNPFTARSTTPEKAPKPGGGAAVERTGPALDTDEDGVDDRLGAMPIEDSSARRVAETPQEIYIPPAMAPKDDPAERAARKEKWKKKQEERKAAAAAKAAKSKSNHRDKNGNLEGDSEEDIAELEKLAKEAEEIAMEQKRKQEEIQKVQRERRKKQQQAFDRQNANPPPPPAQALPKKKPLEAHVYREDGLLEVNPNGAHPILQLIHHAEAEWVDKNARASKTFEEAVAEYERRYHRKPPLGFDIWWFYVEENAVRLPDEYDMIYRDLEPYWGMSTADLARIQSEWESHVDSYTIGKIVHEGKAGKMSLLNMSLPHPNEERHRLLLGAWEIIEMLEDVEEFIPPFRAVFSPHDNPNLPFEYLLRTSAIEAAAKHESAFSFLSFSFFSLTSSPDVYQLSTSPTPLPSS